jgi:hypothetical protein
LKSPVGAGGSQESPIKHLSNLTELKRMKTNQTQQEEGEWIYARYITKNGKRIYPKNAKFFRFLVKPKP